MHNVSCCCYMYCSACKSKRKSTSNLAFAQLFWVLVMTDFNLYLSGIIIIRITKDRREKLLLALNEVLSKDSMTSGEASSLRGKLFLHAPQHTAKLAERPCKPLSNANTMIKLQSCPQP